MCFWEGATQLVGVGLAEHAGDGLTVCTCVMAVAWKVLGARVEGRHGQAADDEQGTPEEELVPEERVHDAEKDGCAAIHLLLFLLAFAVVIGGAGGLPHPGALQKTARNPAFLLVIIAQNWRGA